MAQTERVYFDPARSVDHHGDSELAGPLLYTPATVLERSADGTTVKLRTADCELRSVAAEGLRAVAADDEVGLADVMQLADFSERSLLHTLRVRYARDDIFTSAGQILISINPFKECAGLFGRERMRRYHGSARDPHATELK